VGGSKAPTAAKLGTPAAKSTSTGWHRDMACHTCGGKGNFKRDCPNAKVMLLNHETNEYKTGDDADPFDGEDDDLNDTFYCAIK
jgi:hypothetical protein